MGSSSAQTFPWPDGRRAALSFTYDDARASQIDRGMAVFARHGIRVTFYVSPGNLEQRLSGWRAAVAAGHEIGNHTLSHPCSGNFRFARDNALEDYSLERIEEDILGANRVIHDLLGVTPRTFAYPCGQQFVGRGANTRSYVPLIARHFLVGRCAFNEIHNDPAFTDLSQITSLDSDGAGFERMKAQLDAAVGQAGWITFLGHDIGAGGRQTVVADALDALIAYARTQDVWIDTVATIGQYICQTRS